MHVQADRIEREVQGGLSGRPVLSVPHILADEASCYYHGARLVLQYDAVHECASDYILRSTHDMFAALVWPARGACGPCMACLSAIHSMHLLP